ncbi:hypothetical protein pb186bvf_013520 [Paramecium bursaria]
MLLYILFLCGRRKEIGCSSNDKIERLINSIILNEKSLKEKQFCLLIEKEKRIITQDEYTKTLENLGIVNEDYLTIVLAEHTSTTQHSEIQQKIHSQSNIIITLNSYCSGIDRIIAKHLNINIKINCRNYPYTILLNQQPPLDKNQVQENIDTMNQQLKQSTENQQQKDNPLQSQLEELRALQQVLEEKINQLIGELQQVTYKIKYLEESSSLLKVINLNKQNLLLQEQFLMSNIQNKQYVPLDITTQIQQDLEKMKQITLQMNNYQQFVIRSPNQDQSKQIQITQGLQNSSNQDLFPALSSQLQNQFNTDSFQQQNNQYPQSQQQNLLQTIQNQRNEDFTNSNEVQYLKEQRIKEINIQITGNNSCLKVIHHIINQRLKYNQIIFNFRFRFKVPRGKLRYWEKQFYY